MKKKGFTLIELLAVIVVLAIIALIATPIILNVIEKSKIGAAKNSAYGYLESLNYYVAESELNKDLRRLEKDTKYNVTTGTTVNETYYQAINKYVSIKGYQPSGIEDYIILDENGIVKEGILTINGYEIKIENGKVIAIEKGKIIKIEKLEVEKTSITMEEGTNYQINPVITPSNTSDQRVKYESNNNNVEVDEEGKIKALKVGTSKVIVTSVSDKSKKVEIEITIIKEATGLELEIEKEEIELGSTTKLKATLIPSDTTTESVVEYSVNKEGIVEIDLDGTVTGISLGEVEITGRTVNGKTATVNLKVNPVLATAIQITGTKNIEVGESIQLGTTISPVNTTNKNITWTSSNTNIATVENGLVVGKSNGTVNITATTINGISNTVSIVVQNKYDNGTIIYFNPVAGSECTDYVEANSKTGNKVGCMRWYVLNNNTNTLDLLLDHNTTAVVAWNESESSLLMPTIVLNQLKSDTASWNIGANYTSYTVDHSSNNGAKYTIDYSGYKARLITAEEVANVTEYSGFDANTTFWYYFATKSTTPSDTCGNGNTTGCKYEWLYDNTNGCKENGCLNSDDNLYSYVNNTTRKIEGYWTATSAGNAQVWAVRAGDFSRASVLTSDNRAYGVRPVINVSKSLVTKK